jgi:hypothetical protein
MNRTASEPFVGSKYISYIFGQILPVSAWAQSSDDFFVPILYIINYFSDKRITEVLVETRLNGDNE